MHDILGKIDDLDAALSASTDVSHNCKQAARRTLGMLARDISADIGGIPKPGSTMGLAGATITHRPDVVYTEAARQAVDQGGADRGGYLPAQRAAAMPVTNTGPTTHVIAGNAGTIQAPAPRHAAEQAKVGTETR